MSQGQEALLGRPERKLAFSTQRAWQRLPGTEVYGFTTFLISRSYTIVFSHCSATGSRVYDDRVVRSGTTMNTDSQTGLIMGGRPDRC